MSQDAGPVPRNSGILGSQDLVVTCPSLGLAYIPRRPYVADGQYRIRRGCAKGEKLPGPRQEAKGLPYGPPDPGPVL